MLNVETERRSLETTRYAYQLLIPRVHVHYLFKNGMHAGIGIAHFMNYFILESENRSYIARSELRFHQEWNIHQPFGRFRISHRYQVEQRLYMPYNDRRFVRSPLPLEYGFRFRYQFQVQARLTPEDKQVEVFLKLFDELLLQMSKAKPSQPFEANRFYVGVQVKFSPVWSVEAGYLTWFQQKNDNAFVVPHIARITLLHTIDLRKSKS